MSGKLTMFTKGCSTSVYGPQKESSKSRAVDVIICAAIYAALLFAFPAIYWNWIDDGKSCTRQINADNVFWAEDARVCNTEGASFAH